MTKNEARNKIVALLVSMREVCSDVDCRNQFLNPKAEMPDGLSNMQGHILFDRTNEGLDAMRDALSDAIQDVAKERRKH